ncbi:PilZ domain-containing protein [Paenibacillus physcomitrellae]|uniref:PilZ domain-containing protein n=1 Tax=Paenibacillus physcomitrellae TaxID=1619311 RepID=A0ABQ1FQ80_9BACL|nr:PilZ domain-containing protein [Paenibacillus physcomitrellae]GGA26219.1 hypothetical protein GCM10010917_08820 [Paenibacillus physcomitrellae]
MYSRRNEPFRYEFNEFLKGRFEIINIDGQEIESHTGPVDVIDLSYNGAKLVTNLNLMNENRDIVIMLHFKISKEDFSIPGSIVYKEAKASGEFLYGVHLNTSKEIKNRLTQELKDYAWKQVKEKE